MRGRPHGGVGCLWRKDITRDVHSIYYDDERITGLLLFTGDKTLLVLCVHMPVCTTDYFVMYLGNIHAIIMASETSNAVVIGYFNAAPNSRFGRQLNAFRAE